MHIQCNLVVTAASSMQARASAANTLSQASLDIHMNVLQVHTKFKFTSFNISQNILQTSNNLLPVLCRNDATFSKHARMGHAATDILMI